MPGWIDLNADLKESMEGGKIADVGCGCGISTRSLAKLFPTSTVLGIDSHEESIEDCKKEIESAGLKKADARVADAHVWADTEEEASYNVVTMFDCFHDMPDPEGVAKEAWKALRPGGKIFLIEPLSSKEDTTEAKLTVPMAPTFTGFSACCCTPCGKVIPGKEGLGTTAGTDRYEDLFKKAGFSSFSTFGEEMKATAPTMAGFRLMLVTK